MTFSHRLSPSPRAEDDLLVVHANPKDVHSFIVPPTKEQESKLGSVLFSQSPEELNALLENVEAGIIAYGHYHFPNVRHWNQMILTSISSVSNPMDGDTRAKCGLFIWDEASDWHLEIRRIAYDIEQEQVVLAETQPPKWDELAATLEGEIYLG